MVYSSNAEADEDDRKFGETGRVLLQRFIQRASLAISCYHRRRAQTRFSRDSLLRRAIPTDCQGSIPENFQSRARKHVSSRKR